MSKQPLAVTKIARTIVLLRGEKVLLDSDLARLYGVTTKAFNQAVKRNRNRFPRDFMFRVTKDELEILKSQIVTSSESQFHFGTSGWGGRRQLPYAFTEQGVAMLSSVLRSQRAVQVNIAIMRAFVKLREALETNRELAIKFAELEKNVDKHDKEIAAIIEAIRELMAPPEKPRRQIGFHVRETAPRYGTRARR